MTSVNSSTSVPSMPSELAPPSRSLTRRAWLTGIAIALVASILFSTKAIVAKLLYGYQLDAVTVIGFRMMFSVPFFVVLALVQMRRGPALSGDDRWRIICMGLVGYYLSSFLDFLGLQYITAGLERLILFLTPSFVLLISAKVLHKRITASSLSDLGQRKLENSIHEQKITV